jgi:integrase
LNGRSRATVETCSILANTHEIPDLGARKLRDLSADDVDKWLIDKATSLSTRTLRELRSVLKRAITRAQARDKGKRNVVLLCEVPEGCIGRPSKSLTMRQAEALLAAAQASSMHAYIVLSLLIGARTEELRALTWSHVDLRASLPPPRPRPCRHRSWFGGRSAPGVTRRPSDRAARSHYRSDASTY